MDYNNPEAYFSSSGLPQPSSFPTPEEVRQQALERSTVILSEWETLKNILDRHEETLRKRWLKKPKTQRKIILLDAWPSMPATHRPDYEAFRKDSSRNTIQDSKLKDAYMWPYINVEDLVEGKVLLLFINTRGRHPPYKFAHADYSALRLGHISGAIRLPFLNEHTMFLDERVDMPYGRLESWKDNNEAFNLMMIGRGVNPGEGLVILEVQQEILEFLNRCCQLILHDLSQDSLTGDHVPIKLEPPGIIGNPTEWPTLALMATEAPYRLPGNFDFGRLRGVIAAKRSAAEDHIWGLREDPGYFADTVGDWSEHRQEKLLDTNGKRHPILSNLKPLFWERVLGNVISDAYGGLVVWDCIGQQLAELGVLQTKYADVISHNAQLPPDYMKSLLSFRYMLDKASKGPIGNLKTGVPSSPPLRSLFIREPQVLGSNMISVTYKPGVKTDPMLWIFQALWDKDQLFLCGLPGLMDELERLTQSDPEQKSRISAWVARIISDLGVIARARHEIDIYQPWAAGMDNAWEDHKDDIEAEFLGKFKVFAELESNLKDLSLANVGSLSDERFQYPSEKRRTQQVTETMRKAESNLDVFWNTADQRYRKKTGKTLGGVIKQIQREQRELERTPEWTEPIRSTKKKTELQDTEFDQILSQLRMDPKPEAVTKTSLRKEKAKTRGAASSSDLDAPLPTIQLTPQVPDAQPIMTVSRRAFKVLSTLFHVPSAPDQPGVISWQDFLHAMVATGFQPSKLYGSVWQFTPMNLDVERSIQFHEPHPYGKIQFRNARHIGRRLSRAYGWHGGMFVQE